MRQINAAKRNGAKLVVIDPGASRSPNRHTCICRSVLERMWCWRGRLLWSWRDWAASIAPS